MLDIFSSLFTDQSKTDPFRKFFVERVPRASLNLTIAKTHWDQKIYVGAFSFFTIIPENYIYKNVNTKTRKLKNYLLKIIRRNIMFSKKTTKI